MVPTICSLETLVETNAAPISHHGIARGEKITLGCLLGPTRRHQSDGHSDKQGVATMTPSRTESLGELKGMEGVSGAAVHVGVSLHSGQNAAA